MSAARDAGDDRESPKEGSYSSGGLPGADAAGVADAEDALTSTDLSFAASADQQYFLAIEDLLLRLRGAPLMISPKEWQLARRWHQAGIPLALVLHTMETVYHQREERKASGKVNSLSYFKQAIEAAWTELQELGLGARPSDDASAAAAPELDVQAKLHSLADALPNTLEQRERWCQQILACGQQNLPSSAIEAELAALDTRLLDTVAAALTEEARQELLTQVTKTLEAVRARVDDDQIESVRARLFRQRLRSRLALPTLSLFASASS